ncbi:PGPGW domain-containing protein [Nocardioides mangrovicus]|uniref:PGPGW domain-containing protein n=1 Tax=Nocardioides mangrovicus TaxID=2478913 RepID=UPI0018E0A45D|nr:PGPGW domain-containing protein [Nocardioides mangrovicus]
MPGLVRSIAIQVLGWALVIFGLAAIFLPGPGLLALFAGLALLSQQYEWAERRVEPVKRAAMKTARDSVATPGRIALSLLGVAWLVGFGVLWVVSPGAPDWWPLHERWWLPGGWGTGLSLIVSGLAALAMVVYSFVKLRPGRVAA